MQTVDVREANSVREPQHVRRVFLEDHYVKVI